MTDQSEGPPPVVHVMAWVRWLLVAAMAVLATVSTAYSFGLFAVQSVSAAKAQYYCPMHPQVVQDQPGECPICSMTLVPKEAAKEDEKPPPKVKAPQAAPKAPSADHAGHRHEPSDPYFCPMHPDETGTDESARCPICKMKLEKRGPAPAASALLPGVPGLVPVTLSFDRTQLIGMRSAKAESAALAAELKAAGFVSADESRLSRVHARFSGWVERLAVRTTGEKVRAGQVLAAVFNLELLPAQQEFLAARRWTAADGSSRSGTTPAVPSGLEQDARGRLQLFGMSAAEIEGVAKTGKPVRTVAVTAPATGHIVRKSIVQGDYIQPGTELFEIADLSKVWVLADVYEQDMARIAIGQVATVLVGAYQGEQFQGQVGFVAPTVDASTRTLRIRIELDNAAQKLKPGMFADVRLQVPGGHAAVMIPSEALVDTGDYQYVFLAKEAGRFEPRRVRAGVRSAGRVQILEGLSAGDEVVTTANFLIDSESRLQAAVQGSAQAGQ
jgi:membrane fusion protein, copper/silver efflux system